MFLSLIDKKNQRFIELAFLVFALFFGLAFLFVTPAGGGADEPAHIARVYQISHGSILPEEVQESDIDGRYWDVPDTDYALYGGYIDEALVATSVTNMRAFHLSQDIFSFPVWSDERIVSDLQTGGTSVCFVFSNTVVNNPLVYAPQIIAYKVGDLFLHNAYQLILFMRLGSLVFYVAGVWLAIRIAPLGKRTIAILSLMPNSLATNSCVTADVFSHVVIVLFIACLIRTIVANGLSFVHAMPVVALGLLIAACKTTYLPIAFLSFLIPLLVEGRTLEKRQKLLFVALPFIAVGFALIWYKIVGGINTGAVFKASVFPEQQMALVLANPLHFFKMACLGILGGNVLGIGECAQLSYRLGLTAVAPVAIAGIVAAFALDLGQAWQVRPSHRALNPALFVVAFTGVVFVLLASSLLIELALYAQFTALGSGTIEGVQPRYFMPLVISGLVLLGLAVYLAPVGERSLIEKPHHGCMSASGSHVASRALVCVKAVSVWFLLSVCLVSAYSVHAILAQFM